MSQSREAIIHRLQAVFCRCFFNDGIVIDDGTVSEDIDGWDSLSHVRLMMLIEEEFDIAISGAEASTLQNVGELVDLIAARVS